MLPIRADVLILVLKSWAHIIVNVKRDINSQKTRTLVKVRYADDRFGQNLFIRTSMNKLMRGDLWACYNVVSMAT